MADTKQIKETPSYNKETESMSMADIHALISGVETFEETMPNENAVNETILHDTSQPLQKHHHCLILCMCCNDEYYQKEFDDIMSTWGRCILNQEYTNLDIWGYTASNDGKYHADNERHMLYVPVLDSLDSTFSKTAKAIQALDMSGYKYDWIFRTNCSTTINVEMLNQLMESDFLDDDKIYVSRLFLNTEKSAPNKDYPVYQGNVMMFSRKYARLINDVCLKIAYDINDKKRILHEDIFTVDDLAIAAIFNSYLCMQHIKIKDAYRILPTQYMSSIYGGKEPLKVYDIAFFNKDSNNLKNIRNYYYDMKDRYMNFYNNYYKLLNGNIGEMEKEMSEIQQIIIHNIDNQGISNIQYINLDTYDI